MWRSAFGLCAILAAGGAMAQESLDSALQGMEVFDCSAEGTRTLYVFQMGDDGKVHLVGEEAAPVRIEGSGYSVMLQDGAREISSEAYFVYREGTATSGTCNHVSELARASYSVITNGLIPDVDAESADAAGQAAAVMVQAMQSDLDGTQAELATASETAEAATAKVTELDAALDTATAELATTNGELETMRTSAEAASNALAELQASDEATKAELAAVKAELADAMTAVDSFRAKLAEIAAQLSEAESGRMTATEMFDATKADLADLQTNYDAEVAASTALRAELAATTGVLDATEQERRSIVANVAVLNQQMSDLGGQLNTARGATKAAEKDAKNAKGQAAAMSNLAKAALARVATLQGRSITAVRREVCSLMNGARPSVCR